MNGNVLGAAQVWVFAHRRICGKKRVIGRYVVRYSPFLVAFCVAKGKGESPLLLAGLPDASLFPGGWMHGLA